MAINIDISIADKNWLKENKSIEKLIKSVIKKTLPETKLQKFLDQKIAIEISILLTGNKEIQKLNKEYRGKNKPTDVLSFPLFSGKNGNIKIPKQSGFIPPILPLGDIILAFEIIKKEALEQNKSFKNHLTHLVIHSLLHLIGYDHEESQKDAKIMEKIEINLLKNLAINNPYII